MLAPRLILASSEPLPQLLPPDCLRIMGRLPRPMLPPSISDLKSALLFLCGVSVVNSSSKNEVNLIRIPLLGRKYVGVYLMSAFLCPPVGRDFG